MKIRKEAGLTLVFENGTKSGIVKVAEWVCSDIEKCLGFLPDMREVYGEEDLKNIEGDKILFGTVENDLVSGRLKDLNGIKDKREVYSFGLCGDDTLLICGSDKRGCIYGLFRISDLLGVSPFVNWSNVVPPKRDFFEISEKNCTIVTV